MKDVTRVEFFTFRIVRPVGVGVQRDSVQWGPAVRAGMHSYYSVVWVYELGSFTRWNSL